MAKNPVADDEIQLRKRARRRLVGAVALVLVAVVVLPMVLDSEPKQSQQNIDIVIPPIPPQEVSDRPLPSAAVTPPSSAQSGSGSAAAQPPPSPITRPEPPAPATQSEPAAPAPAATAAQYVIQIGCFSEPAKARGIAKDIKSGGVPAFSALAPNGSCTRVRAGPFASERAAEAARERLRKRNLIPAPSEGKIVSRGD